jgi:hypothetical protein
LLLQILPSPLTTDREIHLQTALCLILCC